MSISLNQGIAESDTVGTGQVDLGSAHVAVGAEFGHAQDALLACIEARLAEEMIRLIGPVNEFAHRFQAISQEIPEGAQFCKLVSRVFPLIALQFSNALLMSQQKRIFAGDGVAHLQELGLCLQDFLREIHLDGRKFLAIALIESKPSEIFEVPQTNRPECEYCGRVHRRWS